MSRLPRALVRDMREGAGLSQRALARRAGTSQPAVARYESGAATPSWETLVRIAKACGRQLQISADPLSDPDDVEVAAQFLLLSPEERLHALRRYIRLRQVATRKE